ncbi:MAG: biopolymer transporter ExbD [Verrucomicrobiota bacterium]|jgi:biopolymer transport protein ExbD
MKFPRHSRLLRGPFDMAPFAAVLFLLVIFLMLGALVPIPGLPLRLPVADNLPGIDQPAVTVVVDANGRFYFANQIVTKDKLKSALKTAVQKSREPLTLVIQADKAVTYDQLVHLVLLAQEPDIGITNLLLATLPGGVTAPVKP